MGNRAKLLATVALPIVSIIWQPADAAAFRATLQPVDTTGGVILAQSNGNGESEEELRRKRREQREENRSERNQERQSERNKERQERQSDRNQERQSDRNREERNKKQAEEQKQGNDKRQSDSQRQQREERAKKQQQAEEQKQRKSDEKRQSDSQRQREERNKKREQQAEEQRKSDEKRQSDNQREREERNKKREQQAEEQRRNDEKRQSDGQKAREQKREQEQRAGDKEQRPADSKQSDRKQTDRKDSDRNQAGRDQSDGKQTDRERAREERRQKAESDRERRAGEENRQRPRRERDAEREKIARDPSKTTGTIDLPVVGGAAVLDSDKDADNRRDRSREETRKRREEERRKANVRVPRSDADAQTDRDGNRRRYERHESIDRERGERRDRRPDYRDPDNVRIGRREDNRVIYNIDNRTFVRHYDSDRLSRRGGNTYYETLRGGRVRETIERPGGVRVVTIRNDYGTVIQRSRFVGDREYVLYYVPEVDYVDDRPFYDPGLDLPPMRLSVPVDEYIIDTSSDYDRDYQEFLELPPVEPVERVYTLDEVKYSARIRDKVRRIDLDTITFATGSAEISMEQASTLRQVADAINNLLDEDPSETFLIEGHTDAVGSDDSNLILSDERAESVANLLTDVYDIPPENLSTQGYGERYLKVATDGPEQLNRRVTIRRVTPLVKPVASAE
ncbi:OmpA family protein [Rhizobium sp. GN54]|uniref:OmpA family protein n=1 Tax=Rhizobium sp. GN54 TaxID=2898150 RepID=UPI001E5D75DD|nr:OmpA family protein [Rhizobium sp. GN54]MCD2184550.1 OmpA family protein [Rhizobium sp. GN54]